MNNNNKLNIRVKRIYEMPEVADGHRLLVDRLWPRGLSKSRAAIDGWMKDIGPSTQLRRWFCHDASRWLEFKRRYFIELEAHHELVEEILSLVKITPLTLLYSTRDVKHNQAVALAEYLIALNLDEVSCISSANTKTAK